MNIAILVTGSTRFAPQLELAATVTSDVTAYVIGDDALVAFTATTGVDAIVHIGTPTPAAPVEAFAAATATALSEAAPALVIADSSDAGRVIAAAVAARIGTATLTGVTTITETEITHGLYGGLVTHTVANPGTAVVMVAGSGEAEDIGGTATVTRLDCAPTPGLTVAAREPLQRAAVDISAAKRVVAIGRGFAAREDIALADELAAALGAEVGGTRPLAESVDWLPRERYIGVSGVQISPELYIGIGLSGQIQHFAGVKAATVVGINSDPHAALFTYADFGLLGDLYELVPALTDAIKAAK